MSKFLNFQLFNTLLRRREPNNAHEDSFDVKTAIQRYESLRELTQDTLDDLLLVAIEAGRGVEITARERESQLVSFVWGNVPEDNQGNRTRETVRKDLASVANS